MSMFVFDTHFYRNAFILLLWELYLNYQFNKKFLSRLFCFHFMFCSMMKLILHLENIDFLYVVIQIDLNDNEMSIGNYTNWFKFYLTHFFKITFTCWLVNGEISRDSPIVNTTDNNTIIICAWSKFKNLK